LVNGESVGDPIRVGGDTIYYKIGASTFNNTFGLTSNGDDFLDFNESILICEVWKGEDCQDNTPIVRGTRYGCEENPIASCQESNIVNTGVSYEFSLPELVARINEECIVRPACYSDENAIMSITLTNEGVGPAKDVTVDIWQNGFNGAIVSSSLLAITPDGTSIVGTFENTTDIDGNQACSAAPGNFKGLDAIFSDVNLFPGEVLKITWELNHGCDCRACDINNIYDTQVRDIAWTDFCDRSFVDNNNVEFPEFDARLRGFFEGESYITGGSTCINYQITTGGATWMSGGANNALYPDAYFESQLTIDCGLDLTSFTYINTAGNPVPAATNIVTNADGGFGVDDEVVVQINRNVAGTFEICFNVDCAEKPGAACTTSARFTMTNFFVADPVCALTCQANVSCEVGFAAVFDCPPCDPCDGLTHLELDISRTNYGQEDANNDQLPDGPMANADSPGVKPKRFLAGDTLKATLIGIVNDGSPLPNPHLWENAFLELDVQTSNFSILGGNITV